MKTRVVVLSASVGTGHLRAAEAVELALKQIAPDVEVQNRDVLDFTNAVFRRMYSNAYLDLVNYFPHFVGYFYDWLEGGRRSPTTARAIDCDRPCRNSTCVPSSASCKTSNGTW